MVAADPYLAGPSPEMLASHTIGWWRRQQGVERMCDTALVALAHEVAKEAIRRIARDRITGIYVGIEHAAELPHIAQRLRRLADDIDPPNASTQRQEAA
jgi:hypothetical protein